MKESRSGYLFSRAAVVLTALLAVSANAGLMTVRSSADPGGTCPGATCTLRQAIATAASGDTIDFAPGITTINLTIAQLLITKDLTIRGPGANLLSVQRSAVSGTPLFRIFDVVGNISVTISGLTIANGSTGSGGGIVNDLGSTLNIINCAIAGNSAFGPGDGAGIYNIGASSTVIITNSTISGNTATNKGGGVINEGMMTITNSTISGNSAASGGGVGSKLGTVTITNSTIANNETIAGGGGGILVDNGTTVNLRNTLIALNTASTFGPDFNGILFSQGYNLIGNKQNATIVAKTGDQIGTSAAPINPLLGSLQNNGGPTMTRALLSGSPAIETGDSGGANTDQRGFARPVDSPSIPNVGDGSDIGAYEVQPDLLPGCSGINRVVNNNNDSGTDSLRGVIAAVCAGSTITFAPNVRDAINLTSGELLLSKSLTIVGPGANLLGVQRSAAAGTSDFRIFNIAGNVTAAISGLTIANGNVPSSFGGGISNNATLTLANSAISGNSALLGGGIGNNGTLNLTNSTISGNSAGTSGGGISGGTVNVVNSTISGNMAHGGNTGGISGATVILTNSTISGNSASGSGGGVFNNGFNGATVTVTNTIIALNTAASAPDCSGSLTSQGFNLIGSSSGAAITPAQFSDQIGVAAAQLNLGPLQNNGGPTFTHALLSGSFAIDKGNSSGSSTDQRGYTRPVDLANIANVSGGDGSDIGALEFGGIIPVTLANISTRLRVETGDNVLIGGFIVTGTQPKKIIVRGIGPSLPFADKLANPTLDLFQGDTLLETNDNWMDSPNKQAIIDSTIPPSNPLESAIVRSVMPGNYTAIVRGVNNGTGIGVVEAYDLDTTTDSKLANIATRGLVQTGDNILIAGTIVVGQALQKVIIRALGPSIPVAGSVGDPILELFDGNGALLEANDNWIDSLNKQAIIDSTVPPTNNLESAIVRTLAPATYTAIVRGANNATGIAVVEVYALN